MSSANDREAISPESRTTLIRNDLLIGPNTVAIETEADLNAVMEITEAFIQRAISEGRSGLVRPPVDEPEVVLSYMELTHGLTFEYVSSEGESIVPQSGIDVDALISGAEEYDFLSESSTNSNILQKLLGIISFNNQVAADAQEAAEIAEDVEADIYAERSLVVSAFDDLEEENKGLSVGEAMKRRTALALDLYASLPNPVEVERAMAYLTDEEIEELERKLDQEPLGLTEEPADLLEQNEGYLDRVSLNTAAWHREQQWYHTPLYYRLRDAGYRHINTGPTALGQALLTEASIHHRLKYEHMGQAAMLERAAKKIEWTFVPTWMKAITHGEMSSSLPDGSEEAWSDNFVEYTRKIGSRLKRRLGL